jgi:hypothetical protein
VTGPGGNTRIRTHDFFLSWAGTRPFRGFFQVLLISSISPRVLSQLFACWLQPVRLYCEDWSSPPMHYWTNPVWYHPTLLGALSLLIPGTFLPFYRCPPLLPSPNSPFSVQRGGGRWYCRIRWHSFLYVLRLWHSLLWRGILPQIVTLISYNSYSVLRHRIVLRTSSNFH